MEHLTRNTNNDRIINAISDVKIQHVDSLNKQLNELVNKTVTVFSGILSSLISGSLISIIKKETAVGLDIVWLLIIFIILLIALWFLMVKYAVPYLSSLLFKEKIDITSPKEQELVKKFNYEIMQKIAEVNEIVDVIQNTDIAECKMLNFVIALHKLQETVDFLYNVFVTKNVSIRNTIKDGSTALLRYSFNRYTVSAVIKTLTHIQGAMSEILKTDAVIKKLDGYDLLIEDFNRISGQINELKKI